MPAGGKNDFGADLTPTQSLAEPTLDPTSRPYLYGYQENSKLEIER